MDEELVGVDEQFSDADGELGGADEKLVGADKELVGVNAWLVQAVGRLNPGVGSCGGFGWRWLFIGPFSGTDESRSAAGEEERTLTRLVIAEREGRKALSSQPSAFSRSRDAVTLLETVAVSSPFG
ncbi:MAG: hypothetical protein HZC54_06475 [Verrucomicrobia bacterium]|nr:hypothetical protein [Verrucomicrobiota bacterium]